MHPFSTPYGFLVFKGRSQRKGALGTNELTAENS